MKVNLDRNNITPLGVMLPYQEHKGKSGIGVRLPHDIIDLSPQAAEVISDENKSEAELFPPGVGYGRSINPRLKILYTKDREAYHHLYNWQNKVDQFLMKEGEFTNKSKDWFVENNNIFLPHECEALKILQADMAKSNDPEVRWFLDLSISSIQEYFVMLPYYNYTYREGKLDLPNREIFEKLFASTSS